MPDARGPGMPPLPPELQLRSELITKYMVWAKDAKRENTVLVFGQLRETHDYTNKHVYLESEAWAHKKREDNEYARCHSTQALQHFTHVLHVNVQQQQPAPPSSIIRPSVADLVGTSNIKPT